MLKVTYDQSQDLTLILNEVDKTLLLKEKTKYFFELPLRGFAKNLEAYVYLAYSLDVGNFLENAANLENLGKILIPNPNDRGYPWLVNLSDFGAKHLESGWEPAPKYDGLHKLFIKISNF